MMKRGLLVAFPVAALFMGGAGTPSAEASETAELPPISAFAPIQRYAISHDEPHDHVDFYLRDYGMRANGAVIAEMAHEKDPNLRVVLVTIDDMEDDAIAGVQWRFDLRSSAGRWKAVEAGMRRKCQRGPNAGEWTREVCP
ncbi:hypothetical protein [Erythrobacter ani]|uniref:Uncharacterized protein n=1 Tax=Erythrobacter ani TaxID=2827235 RepID=A0ABS6SM02_9SPHN|nr:hypothetical protein [Erythrobacter ani]MBV7265537.1 hypothetical protein [Erythrobacter ani]